MTSQCLFEFDRPIPIYHSGETINGRVSFTTTEKQTVNVVDVLFEGTAKVRWEEPRERTVNEKVEKYSIYYRGNETYVNSTTNVFGKGELSAGRHVYTFSISIPLECPTSCVEKYGKIAYELTLKIDDTMVFKQPLTVLQTYNLNMHSEILKPIKHEHMRYFRFWPFRARPVLTTVSIPFGGYAPGQSINYSLYIDNQSSAHDVYDIELSLLQRYKFTATSPEKHSKLFRNNLYTDYQVESVPRLTKRLMNGYLIIPPVPPTSRHTRIVKVHFKIVVSMKSNSWSDDTEFDIPIVIGTIPLAQSLSNPEQVAIWIPSTPDGASADLPPTYDNSQPPTYQEATHIGEKFVDIDVTDERQRTDDFVPQYPVYTQFTEPTAPPPEADAVTATSLPQKQ